MKYTELLNKVIKFTSAVEKCEIDFDCGMKARVISTSDNGDDVLKLLVDFSEFEEENKKFGQANYYDAAGNPTLFWWETKMYPENKRETLYLEIDPKEWPFEVVEENTDKELILQISQQIDPIAWTDSMWSVDRASITEMHTRRQAANEAAERVLSIFPR